MPHDDRVADLLGQIAAGHPDALASLYDALAPRAYGLALRIARNPEIAEEVVQDTFLAIWREAGRFDRQRAAPLAWVLMLVHRRAVDAVRREQHRRADRLPEHDLRHDPADLHHEAWLGVQASTVRAGLASLSEAQRTVLELSYFAGLSQSEVAHRLGEPLGTIKSRTSSALARLRDTLAQLGPDIVLAPA